MNTAQKNNPSPEGQRQLDMLRLAVRKDLEKKTASFPVYKAWSELLPGDKPLYLSRSMNFTRHSTLSSEAIAEPGTQEKQTIKFLLGHLKANYIGASD